MNKKHKVKKTSLWDKIRNFFFPKDFGAEIMRGAEMSSPYGFGTQIYKLGKLARRIVDPQHKMFGQGKEKHNGAEEEVK